MLPLVRPYGADDDTVYLQHVLTEEPVLVEGVSGLVLACGSSPAGELLAVLEQAGVTAAGIGDCLARRRLRHLTREPHFVTSERRDQHPGHRRSQQSPW